MLKIIVWVTLKHTTSDNQRKQMTTSDNLRQWVTTSDKQRNQ